MLRAPARNRRREGSALRPQPLVWSSNLVTQRASPSRTPAVHPSRQKISAAPTPPPQFPYPKVSPPDALKSCNQARSPLRTYPRTPSHPIAPPLLRPSRIPASPANAGSYNASTATGSAASCATRVALHDSRIATLKSPHNGLVYAPEKAIPGPAPTGIARHNGSSETTQSFRTKSRAKPSRPYAAVSQSPHAPSARQFFPPRRHPRETPACACPPNPRRAALPKIAPASEFAQDTKCRPRPSARNTPRALPPRTHSGAPPAPPSANATTPPLADPRTTTTRPPAIPGRSTRRCTAAIQNSKSSAPISIAPPSPASLLRCKTAWPRLLPAEIFQLETFPPRQTHPKLRPNSRQLHVQHRIGPPRDHKKLSRQTRCQRLHAEITHRPLPTPHPHCPRLFGITQQNIQRINPFITRRRAKSNFT